MSAFQPFHAAGFAWEFLEKLGVSVQSAEIHHGGTSVVRCDYTPALAKRFKEVEEVGRTQDGTRFRTCLKGCVIEWLEPASVRRRDTLRRILQRGRP